MSYNGEVMRLAGGFTGAHPVYAAEVATWLGWALPRGVDAAEPAQQEIDAFASATGCSGAGVRQWRAWCRTQLAAGPSGRH